MIDCHEHGAVLHNRFFTQKLVWDLQGFYLQSLVNSLTGTELCHHPAYAFSFKVNGTPVASYSETKVREVDGNLESGTCVPVFQEALVSHIDPLQEQLQIRFQLPEQGLAITTTYRLSDDMPGIVKSLSFKALKDNIVITDLVVDSFDIYPGNYRDCQHFRDANPQPLPPCFLQEGDTDIICCHNESLDEGFLCATSIPGPLRRFLNYPNWKNRDVSYAMGAIPFTKYLKTGETFTSDPTLLFLYAGPREKAYEQFPDLVRTILPPPPRQGVMYCTWIPFLKNIDEQLIQTLANKAADVGCDTFVLDDGWFTQEKRKVDPKKFPNGLEHVSQMVKKLGLHFGLWYNIGTSYGDPQTSDDMACRLPDGSIKTSGPNKVLCFAGHHRKAVFNQLAILAKKYQVDYFKLDFSNVISPYGVLPWGCHSHDHPYHHGYEDSISEMYRGMAWIREKLKRQFPNLLLDFSFETFGPDTPTIAALRYSDLNHVSNYNGQDTDLQHILSIRRTFYRWLAFLPPERILGGLLVLQNDDAPEYLLTAFTGAPLISGDLRALTPQTTRIIKTYVQAFNRLAKREQLTNLKVILNSNDCDAFMRTGKSGHGFLAAFNRQDTELILDIHTPFPPTNVLTGETSLRIPPHDCAMFTF